jgi:hypothetical protein
MIDRPCQYDREAWDALRTTVDEREECIFQCVHQCTRLDECREYLADLDRRDKPVYGVIAGEYRPAPKEGTAKGHPLTITDCVICGAACVSRSAKHHDPIKYRNMRYRHSDGRCDGCFKDDYQARRRERHAERKHVERVS